MPESSRSLKRFQREVNSFAKKLVPEQLVALQTKITLEALRRIVLKTPVDTGRARGNWQTSVGSPAEGEVSTVDTTGFATIAAGEQRLTSLGPFQVTYVTNNVPYIQRLEDGHSPQSPPGHMIQGSIHEIETLFP